MKLDLFYKLVLMFGKMSKNINFPKTCFLKWMM